MQVNNNMINTKDFDKVLEFYTGKFKRVNVVSCDECESVLAIEALIPANQHKARKYHHEGLSVLPVGSKLLASRKRLDGVMGYECICGNDSRLSEPERGVVGKGLRDMMPHEVDMVAANIRISKYKPDIKVDGDTTRVEKFSIKKVK